MGTSETLALAQGKKVVSKKHFKTNKKAVIMTTITACLFIFYSFLKALDLEF